MGKNYVTEIVQKRKISTGKGVVEMVCMQLSFLPFSILLWE